jgi:catechol 2,3-dioxygenase-like lactoylglutathione lyase family enzyme
MSCIDHIGIVVTDFARSRAFYEKALAPLGIKVLMAFTHDSQFAGFGSDRPFFWIGDQGKRAGATHVAFAAPTRAEVDAFHAAALAAGGTDNGAPGLRPHYHADYYGAFVLDPDGHNIEAVNHGAAGPHG